MRPMVVVESDVPQGDTADPGERLANEDDPGVPDERVGETVTIPVAAGKLRHVLVWKTDILPLERLKYTSFL